MNTIRIFRHIACEGPGYFGHVLERRNRPFELIKIDAGETVPDTLDDVAALVFMGGPMSVNDELPWIGQALDLIRRAADRNIPVLGHCLGGQLIAKALGGSVGPNPVREIGWFDVEQLDNATARDWLDGLPRQFTAYHWHGETFTIPDGAVNILKSAHCPHQAFAINNILALQCHVEMTEAMVAEWADTHAAQLNDASPTVQSKEDMVSAAKTHIPTMQACADKLYERWLSGVTA